MSQPTSIDISTFVPTQVIFHKVPQDPIGKKNFDSLELAEAPIDLNPRLVRYFRERIQESLAKRFNVVYVDAVEDQKPSPVPDLILDFFKSNGDNLIDASITMAKHLYDVQTGTSNEGILVVVDGAIASGNVTGKCLVVLKLEPSEALTIDPAKTKDGKSTFAVEVHDVAFEKKARVFKVALFPRADALAKIRGIVADPQQGRAALHEADVALFFLRYLGCGMADTADRQTKSFVEYIDDFANSIADEMERSDFLSVALGDVDSKDLTINPEEVAARALPPELQDDFLAPLRNPDGSVNLITKDRTAIGNRISKLVYEFEDGIQVSGPRDQMAEHVRRDAATGNWVVDAPIKRMGPTGR
jgi:hypothetical protein